MSVQTQNKLLILKDMGGIVTALFHDGRAVELSVEECGGDNCLGSIYIGKVTKVVKNIHAAFVEIEEHEACYLDLSKSAPPVFTSPKNGSEVAAGDELLVQVVRESTKTKAPTVSAEITLAGKYLVLVAGKKGISFSSKLDPEARAQIRERLDREMFGGKDGLYPAFGWVVRTNAAEASEEELLAEATRLCERGEQLLAQALHRPCRTCLYRTPPAYLNRIQSLASAEFDEIVTDDEALFREISEWLANEQPGDLKKLRLYQDRLLPLGKLYALQTVFSEAVKERVWLKSGGYLVIQPTEALTVIDVNSGKYDGHKKQAETFLKINLEAAREAARQMRLRNLSGIIIIDFINMKSSEHQEEVMRLLRECFRSDPGRPVLVDMTPLGLVEATRKRTRKPLTEQLGKEWTSRLREW